MNRLVHPVVAKSRAALAALLADERQNVQVLLLDVDPQGLLLRISVAAVVAFESGARWQLRPLAATCVVFVAATVLVARVASGAVE